MTPRKPELLPSAVPSARDFFSNGKKGASAALLGWPESSWQGNVSMVWGLQSEMTPCRTPSPPGWDTVPNIPVLGEAPWQCTENPQDTDLTNILGFRLCFHGSLGVGFSPSQLLCFQKSPSVPLLRFNAASIPKFQTLAVPSTSFWQLQTSSSLFFLLFFSRRMNHWGSPPSCDCAPLSAISSGTLGPPS